MKHLFFKSILLMLPIWLWGELSIVFAQSQDFETVFKPLSYPEQFLSNWYGNQVNSGSSRIFQLITQGRNGSKALAVQPISSFDGKIWVRLTPQNFESPEVVFFAKSLKNGAGTRSAMVFYSFGESLTGEFSTPTQLGESAEFANENQDWRRFVLEVPEEFKSESEVFLSIDIRYGAGSGSAARWVMDDFEFGDFVRDEVPPKVTMVKGYTDRSILVQFSEKIDPVFSVFPISYELEDQNPELVEWKNDSLLTLTFLDKLEKDKHYSLSIRQIPDLEGNFLQDTTVQFIFSDPTDIPWKALVINELMPAPRADQDLPNVEYLELFHAGKNELRLEGVRLVNSRTETVLGEYWIQPEEFLILAPESQASLVKEFGSVLPIKNWPTLLNSGDQVTLNSASGVEIDQVSYATANWGGGELVNGGYSLEVPNPNFLCDNSILLSPSTNSQRGTPGVKNSIVNPDVEMAFPELENAYFRDSLQISLSFSYPILMGLKPENLSFLPILTVDSLIFLSETEFRILLSSPAEANKRYELRIVGVMDCFGQFLSEQRIDLVLPEYFQTGELIINELLFDPRTGEPKFVEVKNTSQKYLRLENWSLANLDESGSPDQIKVFGGIGSMLEPEGYLAITTDSSALKLAYPKSFQGNFLEIPSLPGYPISGGTIVLLSPKMEIVESFAYNEDLHHPLLRDPKGVSLERISSVSQAFSTSNWQSASGNEDFATPGRKNSQSISEGLDADWIKIEPEVFDPEGSYGSAFTTIRYQLDQTGWVGTFKIYAASGQLIHTLTQNQILGTHGLFTWTGTDSTGKLVRSGYYVLVVELYEPNGQTKVIKRTMVVATRL